MENYFDDISKKSIHIYTIQAVQSGKETLEDLKKTQKMQETRTNVENAIICVRPAQKVSKSRAVKKPKEKIVRRVIKNSNEVYDFI
jgi:hypothetical protein